MSTANNTAYALLGICTVCNAVSAIDLDGTEDHEREMQGPERRVIRVSKDDSRLSGASMQRCNHTEFVMALTERARASEEQLVAAKRDLAAVVAVNLTLTGAQAEARQLRVAYDAEKSAHLSAREAYSTLQARVRELEEQLSRGGDGGGRSALGHLPSPNHEGESSGPVVQVSTPAT
jgi:hypothetical protein